MEEAGEGMAACKIKSIGSQSGSKTQATQDAMWDPEEGKWVES